LDQEFRIQEVWNALPVPAGIVALELGGQRNSKKRGLNSSSTYKAHHLSFSYL
jgi:hypothetical protein